MSQSHSQQPVIFSTDDYLMPQWAGLPKYTFFFEIIKNGSIVGRVDIKKKEFSLVGRLEDLCDIFVDNPTVSRKHAILQFHKQDPLPFLYDLGSAQGTFVNKQQLPPRAYKKLQLFVNVKFGVSSRYYVLRCPELQEKRNLEEEQKENEFQKTLSQQNKLLTKHQAKKRYLQLLENDPYFGGQLKSRKFEGEKKSANIMNNEKDQGISWGIGDQSQVYAYKNERQFPLQPDVIRRLPGLDQTTLEKIAQYEEKFRVNDQIETELNELANKEKKEYGLEEKLQNKKEKLEKRFVESLQALQRCEDWIRAHIFGEQGMGQLQKKKRKQKQVDTFGDDEFYDRTLEDKKNNKETQEKGNKKKETQMGQQPTVQDLWMLKNNFVYELSRKKELLELALGQSKLKQAQKQGEGQSQANTQALDQEGQEDQLQLFMRENDQNLQQENKNIYTREIDTVQEKIMEIKKKLSMFLSEKEILKVEEQTLHPERIREKQTRKQKRQQEEKESLNKTLERLEAEDKIRKQKEERRKRLEQQCTDEYSQKIFDLYKEDYQEQQKQEYDDQRQNFSRNYRQLQNSEHSQYGHPTKRIHHNQEQINNHHEYRTTLQQDNDENKSAEEEVVDLTKNFN